MNYCIFEFAQGRDVQVFGPYDQDKCRAMLASLAVRLRLHWRNNDLDKDMECKHELDKLEVLVQGLRTRELRVHPMTAPKWLE